MKLLIYATFAASVLLFAGLARASTYQSPVQIDQVYFDSAQMQLTVKGNLPNPCTEQPTASLVVDQNDSRTLVLRMTAPMFTDMCMASIKEYKATLDLLTLVRASQVKIDANVIYILKTQGYNFQTQVQGSQLAP